MRWECYEGQRAMCGEQLKDSGSYVVKADYGFEWSNRSFRMWGCCASHNVWKWSMMSELMWDGKLWRTERSMVRAIYGVQLKDRKRSTDLMSMFGLNDTIDHLTMANSVYWHENVFRREDSYVFSKIEAETKGGNVGWKKKKREEVRCALSTRVLVLMRLPVNQAIISHCGHDQMLNIGLAQNPSKRSVLWKIPSFLVFCGCETNISRLDVGAEIAIEHWTLSNYGKLQTEKVHEKLQIIQVHINLKSEQK